MADKGLTRKEFLRGAAMTAVGLVAAGCAAPTPQIIEKPVTVVVEKEVSVEKVVKETVVVSKEVAVEKVVKETVVVEKEKVVEKELVVTATPVAKPKEAPALAELVKAGKLPPLEERLPLEPLVIEPYNEIGQYGGTWHRADTSANGNNLAMSFYGHSPVHWVKDGLDKRGGLAKGWTTNADKTEWTFFFRKGTKWSDGQPFTVDDIIYWYEDLCINPDHPFLVPDWLIAGGKTAELTKVDDWKLKFKFAAPAPLLADRMAMWTKGVPTGLDAMVVCCSHYLKQFHPKYNKQVTDFKEHDLKYDWRTNIDYPVLNPWKPVLYEAGKRILLERNPYYYAVDTEGNQLPYIDAVDTTYVENAEVGKLKVLGGETEICVRPCKSLPLADLSLLRQNETTQGYQVHLWDGGSGTGSCFFCNWNHPDPDKVKVYREPKFRRALSHAIDRAKIQKMTYFGTGFLTTGTMSPKAVEYNRTPRGKELFAKWRDLAVTYDPEAAKKLLDEIGVVDKNGDGWREMPNGKILELRIDYAANTQADHIQNDQLVKENWEAIGLKTLLNPVPPSDTTTIRTNANYDIWDSWEVGDGPNHLVFPAWVVPIENQRWAPLYGQWYAVKGTNLEGTELEKAPRDRTPPREEPAKDDPVFKIQELYDKAKVEPDDDKRESLVLDLIQVHIDYGPFFIGTVANLPTIVVFANNVGNVPNREQLGLGGFTNPWIMSYMGAVYPEQMYFKA